MGGEEGYHLSTMENTTFSVLEWFQGSNDTDVVKAITTTECCVCGMQIDTATAVGKEMLVESYMGSDGFISLSYCSATCTAEYDDCIQAVEYSRNIECSASHLVWLLPLLVSYVFYL